MTKCKERLRVRLAIHHGTANIQMRDNHDTIARQHKSFAIDDRMMQSVSNMN
ncbi:MAG: hypothetical protein OSA92_15690 [Pirellulaceae bacterium]|jgi:hypothetical protein|nr:hypothetical protein [Pirellulaceae bacterium]